MASMAAADATRSFAFVFPAMTGHTNASFPIARELVANGHQVHYLCREAMRAPIEDAGATFHADTEELRELFDGRKPDMFGAMQALATELGVDVAAEPMIQWRAKVRNVQAELVLPGMLRWLRRVGAEAVCFDPLINIEAAMAAQVLGIRSVGLLTLAGAGGFEHTQREWLEIFRVTDASVQAEVAGFAPNQQAVQRLLDAYGPRAGVNALYSLAPYGRMDVAELSFATLVTTSAELQDPMSEEMEASYRRAGVRFEPVGPLLDVPGAQRSVGEACSDGREGEALARVEAARQAGRQVVLVSMGTVLTSNNPTLGWTAQPLDEEGRPRGLTSRDLCRAVWAGAFDACAAASEEEGPLLIVALGQAADPLGDLVPPPNAMCLPAVPQVDVLRARCDAFVTHGGQNSFTEALASGVPLLVCPGQGDQPVNARKAERLGVGLQLPRPQPAAGFLAAAAATFRGDVAEALRRLLREPGFRRRAGACGERLRLAGGVPRAAEVLLEAAAAAAVPAPKVPTEPEEALPRAAAVAGA